MRKQGITFHLLVLGLSTGAWAGQVRGPNSATRPLAPGSVRAPGRLPLKLPAVPRLPAALAVPDVGKPIGPSLSARIVPVPANPQAASLLFNLNSREAVIKQEMASGDVRRAAQAIKMLFGEMGSQGASGSGSVNSGNSGNGSRGGSSGAGNSSSNSGGSSGGENPPANPDPSMGPEDYLPGLVSLTLRKSAFRGKGPQANQIKEFLKSSGYRLAKGSQFLERPDMSDLVGLTIQVPEGREEAAAQKLKEDYPDKVADAQRIKRDSYADSIAEELKKELGVGDKRPVPPASDSASASASSEKDRITEKTFPGIYELTDRKFAIVEAHFLNDGTLRYRYWRDGGITRLRSVPWSLNGSIVSATLNDPGMGRGRLEMDLSGHSISELKKGAEVKVRIPLYGKEWLPLTATKTDRPVFSPDAPPSPEWADGSSEDGVDFSGFMPARIERLEDGRSIAVGGLLEPPQAVNQVAQVTFDQKPGSPTFGKFLAVIGMVEGRDENMEPARLMEPGELKGLEWALRRHLNKNPPNPSRKALFEELIDAMAKSARPPSHERSNPASPKAGATQDLTVSVMPMPREISQRYQADRRRIRRRSSPVHIGEAEVETVYVHAAMARFQPHSPMIWDKKALLMLLKQMGESRFLSDDDISPSGSKPIEEQFGKVLKAFEEYVGQVAGENAFAQLSVVTDRTTGKGIDAEHFERMLVVYPQAGYALLVEVVFGL